jgi:hypothetical protein
MVMTTHASSDTATTTPSANHKSVRRRSLAREL